MNGQQKEDVRISELERLEKEFGLSGPSEVLKENGTYFSAPENRGQSTESRKIKSKSQVLHDNGTLNKIRQKYEVIENEQSEVAARLSELERMQEQKVKDLNLKEQASSEHLQFLAETTRDANAQISKVDEIVTSPEENWLDHEEHKLAHEITQTDELYTPAEHVYASTALLMKEVMGPSLENYSAKEGFFSERDATVHAGNTLSVPVRVSTPGTIVEFSIEKKSYDFGFAITAFMDGGTVEKIKEISSFGKKTDSERIVVPAGCAPCTMQFKFANNYSTLLEKVQLDYKIRVIPPSAETIKLGRRRRAKSSLQLLESELSSQREILKTSNSQVAELEREAMELQNEIINKGAKVEAIRADEERLKKLMGSLGPQTLTKKVDSGKFFNDF